MSSRTWLARPNGPALAPDGAILRRRGSGETVPLGPSDIAKLVRPTPEPEQLAELQDLIGVLNERLWELQRTLDDERDAAATETDAQAAERAEAAKRRTLGARLTDWIVAGVIGALLGAVVTVILH